MTDQEAEPAKDRIPETILSEKFRTFEQFLVHGLNCTDPECLIPLCVNTKLIFKHTRGCSRTYCSFCDRLKYQIPKHTESCVDNFCSIPFCLETKLKKFLESQVDQSEDSGATTQRQEKQLRTEDGKISSINTQATIFQQSPQMTVTQSKAEDERGCYGNMSRKGVSASNELVSSSSNQIATELSANRRPPRAPKITSNQSYFRAKATQAIKARRLSLVQNSRGQIPTRAGTTHSGTRPPIAERETVTQNDQGLKKFASVFFNVYDNNAVTHRIDENKKLHEFVDKSDEVNDDDDDDDSVCSQEEDSLKTPRAVTPHVNMGLRRFQSKPSSHKSSLLKARFFRTLLSLMCLIVKTKRRRELLVCVRSLRSAIQEIKYFDQAFS